VENIGNRTAFFGMEERFGKRSALESIPGRLEGKAFKCKKAIATLFVDCDDRHDLITTFSLPAALIYCIIDFSAIGIT
jgi:hypothetical protein